MIKLGGTTLTTVGLPPIGLIMAALLAGKLDAEGGTCTKAELEIVIDTDD